jgi:hypothetical protein
LTLGQPPRNIALQAHLQSRRPLALLVVALILCLFFAFVFANVAWAKEQPSSKEQQQPRGESTSIGNGKQVSEPAPTSTPVSSLPPVEPSSIEKLPEKLPPPPADSVPPKADPEPAPQPPSLQRTMVITTTDGETVGPSSAEPVSSPQQTRPTSSESPPTTPTNPSDPAPVAASAAPTPDLGSPETEIPAAAEEEIPAAGSAELPTNNDLSAPPSEASEPVIPALALQQQVAQRVTSLQGVASEEQAQPSYYSTSGITPASAGVQPLTWTLNNVIGTSTSAAAGAVAGVWGTVGNWLTEEATSSTEDSSASQGTGPAPLAPVRPQEEQQPLGSIYMWLASGMGQTGAGGLGNTLLLGVLLVASIVLLRRDFRTYLVSIELPKPSSALLSPLERPG